MAYDPYKALYLHIPFCVKRCGYCDFATSAVERDSPIIDEYVESLVMDIRRASREGKLGAIETVYLGGGTPSYIGMRRLSMLLYALSMSMHLEPEVECTMEANPESLTAPMVRDIWALGVNRLSLGVQSFDDEVLRILGRAHDAEAARAAVRAAQERFENVSVDLMCGIPGQSEESFAESVREAVALGANHVSVYPLTIEPHTPFDAAIMRGEMLEPDEDAEAAAMEEAQRILEDAGFHRYEVASYARPGFESRHNTAYWTGKPYLGLGRSAVTMTQNAERRMRVQDGQVVDDLDARQMAAEDLMLGMRMARGVSDEQMEQAAAVIDGTAVGRKGEGELGRGGGQVRRRGRLGARCLRRAGRPRPGRAPRGPLASHRRRLALRQRALRPPARPRPVACRCLPPLLVCRLRRDGGFR